jgi:hypothetical protein
MIKNVYLISTSYLMNSKWLSQRLNTILGFGLKMKRSPKMEHFLCTVGCHGCTMQVSFRGAHCQFSGFSFTFKLCYFCHWVSTLHNLLPNFFVKSQCSALKNFIWQKNFFFNLKKVEKKFLRILIASYGARVRGSVFKMEFKALFREFESIETSPGFAQFLGENWI